MRKYQNQPTTWAADNQDMYVIRYADVLLMRAEALAKQNTGKDEIMSMVNQVRQRADVMMPKVEDAEGSNLSYDQLLDVVKHERRVELALEGTRYFDLMRWKEMDKAYERCRADGGAGSHICNSLREIFIKRDSPHGRKRTPNVLIVPDNVINAEQISMGPTK